jgi:hypothetical protein
MIALIKSDSMDAQNFVVGTPQKFENLPSKMYAGDYRSRHQSLKLPNWGARVSWIRVSPARVVLRKLVTVYRVGMARVFDVAHGAAKMTTIARRQHW